MSDATPKSISPNPQPEVERSPDYRAYYANNINFESTAWDMKLTFGHLDMVTAPIKVKNDCSITIPWPQAKFALFWLRLHVESAEAEVGAKIPIRKDLWPVEFPNGPPDSQADPVKFQQLREIYERLREEFLKTL
jgi:hypothetical protein